MSEADCRHVMRHMETQQCEVPANPRKFIENSTTGEADDAAGKRAKKMTNGKKNAGAFAKLQADLARAAKGEPMGKGQGTGVPVTQSTGTGELDQTSLIAKLKAPKAPRVDMFKALTPALDKARALAKSLTAGYDSDSATLAGGSALRTQSMPKKVFVKMEPAPLTGDQITKAASAALSAGAITGAEANHIATHVALNGGKHCDADLLKKIGSHVK